jgi:membrane fusion protein
MTKNQTETEYSSKEEPDNLFRQEVLELQSQRLIGKVMLTQPISIVSIVFFLICFTTAIIMFFSIAEYSRKVRVTGVLIPSERQTNVVIPYSSTLKKLYVNNGQKVHSGQLLAELSVYEFSDNSKDGFSKAYNSASDALAAHKKRTENQLTLLQLTNDKMVMQYSLFTKRLNAMDKQIEIAEHRNLVFKKQISLQEPLTKSGLIPHWQFESLIADQLLVEEGIQSLNINKMESEFELASMNKDIGTYTQKREEIINNAFVTAQVIEAEIINLEANHSDQLIAKTDGIVHNLHLREGETVEKSKNLLTLLPENFNLIGKVFLPTYTAGTIPEHAEMRIRLDAFPYERFGLMQAKLTNLDSVVVSPHQISDPINLSEPVYQGYVALSKDTMSFNGQQFRLKPGMTFEADIIIETRTVFEWITAPILGLNKR